MQIMESYKNVPVLVTGGAGFIGSHLVEALVASGAQVTVLDDLSTGSFENLHTVRNQIAFIHGSITDAQACLVATRNQKIIFHLAAMISVVQSCENPAACHAINIDGTANVLEAARLNGVERFVFSSSAAVYGTRTEPCSEESPCAPTSPYGFSKFIGEQLCKQYAQLGLKTACLRYFNVFGPRQSSTGPYGTVMATFTKYMEENMPLTIYGDGTQTRDFVPVHLVVEANMRIALLEEKNMHGDVFNVATGKSLSLLELVEQMKQKNPQFTAPILFKPARPGDIKHSIARVDKFYKIKETILLRE
jgi:nucleoside-diphosphate-sugar epimerase